MMQRRTYILLLIFLPLFSAKAEEGDKLHNWLDSARAAYDADEAKKALGFYEKVAAESYSSSLYYNMGNAAFKAGELGEAILYYRKAEKKRPWDPDVKQNLELALEKTRDDFEGASSKSMVQSIEKFVVAAPIGDRWTLAFIASLLSGIALGMLPFAGRGWRSSLWGLFFLFLFLAGFFYAAERWRISILDQEDRAVIMSPSVQVRTAPSKEASTAFVLHEGSTVDIRKEEGTWTEVRTPDDQVGWIRKGKLRAF